MSKITFEQAEEIRYLAKGGKVSRKELSERFGVGVPYIGDVINYHYLRPAGMPKVKRAKKSGKPKLLNKTPQGPRNICACGCGAMVISLEARWVTGHQMRDPKIRALCPAIKNEPKTDAEFIAGTLANCEPMDLGAATPCMIWQGFVQPVTGYSNTTRFGTCHSRHRLMYEATRGVKLPSDLHVDHRCAHEGGRGGKLHRLCQNPDHLQALSQAENVQKSSQTKMDPEKVRMLRRLRAEDPKAWTFRKLAEWFGVSNTVAFKIVHRTAWTNVH